MSQTAECLVSLPGVGRLLDHHPHLSEETRDLCGPGAEPCLGPKFSDPKSHGPDVCPHLVERIQRTVCVNALGWPEGTVTCLCTCYA